MPNEFLKPILMCFKGELLESIMAKVMIELSVKTFGLP